MKLELIKPYEMQQPGTVIVVPGGIASVLIVNKIAKPADESIKRSPVRPRKPK